MNIGNEMIEMFARRFRHVIFLYDMDEAGKRESTRQCEIFTNIKQYGWNFLYWGQSRKKIFPTISEWETQQMILKTNFGQSRKNIHSNYHDVELL